MRRACWALMLCCVVSIPVMSPAAARDAPFCIKGCDFGGGAGDCHFSTYQQCLATASGRDATCAANPYFNANDELLPKGGRLSRKR